MPAMNPIERFFVNASATRRSRRRLRWIRQHANLPEGTACLEIGCGNGTFAAMFTESFHPRQYLATDFDPLQLAEATGNLQKRYPNGLPSALVLQQADMLKLPFPDARFDVALAFVALHHAGPTHQDPARIADALSEVDRVLRPGGSLLYTEIFHRELIRNWLTGHGFKVTVAERGWRRESVVARKSIPSVPGK